jgi:hypothetical protein
MLQTRSAGLNPRSLSATLMVEVAGPEQAHSITCPPTFSALHGAMRHSAFRAAAAPENVIAM